jgi:adenosine kinase
MLKNKPLKIAVSGSLAYDKIMDFPGCFSDHILPGQIHNLNLSFALSGLKTSFGGTAGNIAYNLTLLHEQPIILGIVGFDFLAYRRHLATKHVNLKHLATVRNRQSATAYIMTDKEDNQIAAFYPGPQIKSYARTASQALSRHAKNLLAIISPDDKKRMLDYATVYQKNKIPYIFDPGQALTILSAEELRTAVKGAKVLIGNDYEIKLIAQRLKSNLASLAQRVEILVITKGSRGSEIYQNKQKIVIKPAKPKNTSDPTGAGDAYRAGLIKGLIHGWDLKTCGQLAATVAVYTVEKFGTQTHRFSLKELAKRYYQNYHEKLLL